MEKFASITSKFLQNQTMGPFFQQYPGCSYPKGYICLYPSDPPDHVYYIKEGYVRLYDISTKTGSQFTIHFFTPGSVFPITHGVGSFPSPYFYETFTEVKLYRVPSEDFKQYLEDHPDQMSEVMQSLVNGSNALVARMRCMAFGNSYALTIAIIMYLSWGFGKRDGASVHFTHRFTHQDIAQLAGLTRETVTAVMNRLIKAGLMGNHGRRLEIKDFDRLTLELRQHSGDI